MARAAARTRREWLAAAGAAALSLHLRPARADSAELAAAIHEFAGGAPVREGRVNLDIAPLVENGNTVPVTVEVTSPMTPSDHVAAIALFSERNPLRDVARFGLGRRSGLARVSTRIRLATSQNLVAVARLSDGSYWSHRVEVVVTLAACVEP